MLSSATASTDLTAIVLDANGQAKSGQTVIFSKGNDNTAYYSGVRAITDANGIAAAKLNIGTSMANRVISVSATAGAAVGANTVTVAGTKISVSGNTSLALNASSALNITVKDSTGVPVPGIALAATSQNSNPIVLTPSSGITDSNGQMTASVTAVHAGAGADVLTITGAGASQTQSLNINSSSFTFTAPAIVLPASTPEILVNTPTPVSVRWLNAGAPMVNAPVNFYTSRGTIAANPVLTDISGIATASVSANSTGTAIFTASGTGGTPAATLNVVFVTANASSIALQANPSTVGVNTTGSTTKQSAITAVVRDSNNNLVKNAHIVFSLVADASGGSLTANDATTDISGAASVNYIAGTSFSGQNGVQINAIVDTVNGVTIPNIQTSVGLTVASQALYVRLATDNKIIPDAPVRGTYTKKYIALVSDAAGNPAPDGTQVRFKLSPTAVPNVSFMKGTFSWVAAIWVQNIVDTCPSEDANRNNALEPGEDTNGNGHLDPNGVAVVNATALTTSGFALAEISYAKDYATWALQELEARAGTVGNDPPSIVTFVLTGEVSDYQNKDVPPSGAISPFGALVGCNNTD